ncbi:hypothetical protein BHYA_0423g00030 [Botrytis hyacinthi]|uniref:Uncharacterized protein n=1 Tax=Botrytis hyacinthi TaxID=278943 RepID=A0A4Z1G6W7_9HELO|nr:hypothetical protein BHYA_0423g00030 [Botrytis hyacinthi]
MHQGPSDRINTTLLASQQEMAPRAVQDAHDSLVQLSRQCSEAHQLLYLNQGEEYPELLMGRIQRGTALMQRAIATFYDDLKSFAATKAFESTKSSDEGVNKLLATQKIPGLTLLDADKNLALALVEVNKNLTLASVDADKNLALTSVNADKIPESTEPPVRQLYHENGRGLNGAYLDPYLSIFLLACTENHKVRVEDQVQMKGRWLKFPWKLFCDFAKKQSGYDDVEYFTAYKAFKTLRSLGLSLKQLEGVDENKSFSEREEMIAMARFLGMSEESIEEKVVEDMSEQMASKDVSVKKVAQEGSDFIAFDDPIDDLAPGQRKKKVFTSQLAAMAPPAGEDVLGVFIHLNQQVSKAVQLLNCSLKIERVLAASNDAQTFEKNAPTKSSSMVPMTPGISIYQPDGSVNDGQDRAVCTHIILLAKDEDPMKPLAYQPPMNNNWVRCLWEGPCEKCLVVLHLLDHSLLPRRDGEQRLLYDPQNTNFWKASYHYIDVYFTRFMRPRFAQELEWHDKVKDLNDWEAFRAVRRIGFRLKDVKNCEKVVEAMEKVEMVNMGRFLGMTESSIRDICNDGTDADMTILLGLEAQMPQKFF